MNNKKIMCKYRNLDKGEKMIVKIFSPVFIMLALSIMILLYGAIMSACGYNENQLFAIDVIINLSVILSSEILLVWFLFWMIFIDKD